MVHAVVSHARDEIQIQSRSDLRSTRLQQDRSKTVILGARWAAFAAGDAPWWPSSKAPARGARAVSDEAGATRQQQTQTAKLEVGAASRGAPPVDFKKEDCAF